MNSQYQKFEMATLKRSQIVPSPYNPRVMDPHARSVLKAKTRQRGLVDPLIVNRRNHHLVSGHQRLSVLDDLNKGKGDYDMRVALVDLDDKTEREVNIFLNNPASQGEWQPDKLQPLLMEVGLDAAGLSKFDLQLLFDDAQLAPFFQDNASVQALVDQAAAAYNPPPPDPNTTPNTPESKARHRQHDHDRALNADPKSDVEYYVVIVCNNEAERQELFGYLNMDPGPTLNGRKVVEALNARG